MLTSYLLKGGLIATFTSDNQPRTYTADVLVEDSIITKIANSIEAGPSVEVIDCKGKWITLKFVLQAHLHDRATRRALRVSLPRCLQLERTLMQVLLLLARSQIRQR